MEYKRLEIYTGWKCNHKCVFCIEFPNMEESWDREVTKKEMMKKLISYRKKGYNHVTFLGGEPFIHPVLKFATTFAKKIGYTTLVTTNASTLQFDLQAKKQLPTIDQLLISVPIIDTKKQLKINQTKGIINFELVFENIGKYWDGNFLKINTVINQLNLFEISKILHYIGERGVKEMSITYPDITIPYYSVEHIKTLVAPRYSDVAKLIPEWFTMAKKYGIRLILTDVPFCCFPNLKYIQYTDDYVYQTRLKVNHEEEEVDREEFLPRRRKQISECQKCAYKKTCWGPSIHYHELYDLEEIQPIETEYKLLQNKSFLNDINKMVVG